MGHSNCLVFVKLGGALITDKRRPFFARHEVIQRLARELLEARQAGARILLGHGGGSFAHQEASRLAAANNSGWLGYARITAAARSLNALVVAALLDIGLPAIGVSPSSAAVAQTGRLAIWPTGVLSLLLEAEAVPVIHGDVVVDSRGDYAIISTEQVLAHLAVSLRPRLIVLATDVDGVLTAAGETLPLVTPADLGQTMALLGGSSAPDVTGGMASKIETMVDLVGRLPLVSVHIVSGLVEGRVRDAVLGRYSGGTWVRPAAPIAAG